MSRRPRRIRAVITSLVCGIALVGVPVTGVTGTGAASPIPSVETEPLAMSDAAKRELILEIIETFVPHAESFRTPSDLTEQRTDFYAAVGPGVTQPRGAGNIALAYATLLTGKPDQPSFGGVSRAELIEHTIQSIRHEALTSKLSGAGYNRWGQGTWQASLETYGWGWAAHLLWDHLDDETRAWVERVVVGEADILIDKRIASGSPGNTAAEDNAWNSPTPALAAVMFPGHPNREKWEESAIRLALNASSAPADEESDEIVDGRPVREWMESVNVRPDLTMENHGFFNPIYQQVVHVNIGEAAAIYESSGHPLPEAFSFRVETIWDRILGPLTADDGDLLMPAGQDWTSKDFQHLDYLTVLATRFGRAEASVAESRALQLVARRQATHDNGSILGQPQLGYETMLIKRLTAAWWNHELFGPSPQPTPEEYEADRDNTGGVHTFEYADMIQARQRDALVTMSWSPARPMGLIVPSAQGHRDDPVFAAYPPGGLTGGASGPVGPYSCDCREDSFSTAGSIGQRLFSMTSFADGTVLLLDRGTGPTFTLAFERIPGLAADRPVYSETGEGLGDLPGSWLNVDDRLGLVVAGGGGLRARDVQAANPYRLVEGSAGTGSGNRGAAVYPLAERETTARLAPTVRQPETPQDWSALTAEAPDGTVRLAVARWGGPASAPLELTDARGGPVSELPGVIDGTTTEVTVELDAPASRSELLRYFVAADGPVRASLDGEHRATLTNDADQRAVVAVTYVTEDGNELTAERELFPGEQVTARMIGGELSLAGPEHEPLHEAAGALGALADQVEQWRQDGTLTGGQASELLARIHAVSQVVDDLLDEAVSVRPDTARLDALTRSAQRRVERLRGTGSAEVRQRVDADRQAVTQLIDTVRTEALGVTVRVEAGGLVLPGEVAPMTVTLTHRGVSGVTDGTLALDLPDGLTAEPAETAVPSLAPERGQTFTFDVSASLETSPGPVTIDAVFGYRWGAEQRTSTGSVEVPVDALLTATAVRPAQPLAAGGWTQAEIDVTNAGSRPLDVELSATTPDGVVADDPSGPAEIGPGETERLAVGLTNDELSSGSGEVIITARIAGTAVTAEASVRLDYTSNLALNGVGASWPAAFADSNQAAYPPALANDGDPATFWVAAGVAAGDGPTPERPISVGVDFGRPVEFSSVAMTPRPNFGPTAYTIEISDDGASWRTVADVAQAPASGTVTTALDAPMTATQVRLRITGGWDRIQPPRNVQVADLGITR